jgi:hypothetical protein
MMLHPERCAETILGDDEGKLIFLSMLESLKGNKKQLKMVGLGECMANRSCIFAITLSESARWKPSGIPSATVFADREASVSSSFPC